MQIYNHADIWTLMMKQLQTVLVILLSCILLILGACSGEGSSDSGRNDSLSGPLRVNQSNPRYFTDDSGKAIYLTGSHTWSNLMDIGPTDPTPKFDYEAYLNFLMPEKSIVQAANIITTDILTLAN